MSVFPATKLPVLLPRLLVLGFCFLPASLRAAEPERPGIVLHARDAQVHGEQLRYEPQPEKNTLGYWTRAEDWASWDFEVKQPGRYEVTILQGCGKGSGGATVELRVGEQAIEFTVVDTGHFQNFVPREVGAVELVAGQATLSVKPKTKPGAAVMDLREITLTRVADTRPK